MQIKGVYVTPKTKTDDKDRYDTVHLVVVRKSDGVHVGALDVGYDETWHDGSTNGPFFIELDNVYESSDLRLHIIKTGTDGWTAGALAEGQLQLGGPKNVLITENDFATFTLKGGTHDKHVDFRARGKPALPKKSKNAKRSIRRSHPKK